MVDSEMMAEILRGQGRIEDKLDKMLGDEIVEEEVMNPVQTQQLDLDILSTEFWSM